MRADPPSLPLTLCLRACRQQSSAHLQLIFFPTVVIRIVLLLSNCLSRVNEATRPQHYWRKGKHWSLIYIFLVHSMDIFILSWWGSSIIHNPCLLQQGGGHTEMTEG